MKYTINGTQEHKAITLSGQFTFSDSHKFAQIIEAAHEKDTREITLDFAEVDFIDSAGLGMLLLLRDECQQKNIAITVRSAQGQVEKIFMLSKFDQLFTMQK